MNATNERNDPLESLLATLDRANTVTDDGTGGDAIDRELKAPRRETATRSLRDAPEVIAFRQAMIDGMVRADTVNRLLRFVDGLLAGALTR